MNFVEKTVFVTNCDGYGVMVLFNGCWEIYYSKPEHPYIYAFGVSKETTLNTAMMLAEANIEQYSFMFES